MFWLISHLLKRTYNLHNSDKFSEILTQNALFQMFCNTSTFFAFYHWLYTKLPLKDVCL